MAIKPGYGSNMLLRLIHSILDDDHGISEDAWNEICEMSKMHPELLSIILCAESYDGRYYLRT